MASICPPVGPEYNKLVNLLNGDTRAAYRMWRAHEDLHPGQGIEKSFETFNRPIQDKIDAIENAVKNIEFDDINHKYSWKGDSSIQIASMSEMVDTIPELSIKITGRNIEKLSIYSESGTLIHDLFQKITQSSDPVNDENLKKFASDRGIPQGLLNQLFDLKTRLSKMGTLVSEKVLYAENSAEGARIAGRSDLIIYSPEGRKYIVDLKTTYRTQEKKKSGDKVWDPLAYNSYKAKRYSVQTMGYGRMTEWADNQPVSDHFIVPIELELVNENDISFGYADGKVLPMESIKSWKTDSYATRQLDIIFGKSSFAPSSAAIIGKDDSSDVFSTLTGSIATHIASPSERALRVKRGYRGGIFGYIDSAGNHHAFTSSDPAAQNQQIVDEYVKKSEKVNNDLALGVANYLESGDVKYLRSIGDKLRIIETSLRPFIRRNDIKVSNLSDIKGFEDKKNWIIIEDGKNRHLIYIGAEDLNRKFSTEGYANNSLFGKFGNKLRTDRINSPYKNTLGDARKFEGVLIAMKLKEANPDIGFGLNMVFGIGNGSAFGDAIDIKEGLETIKSIKNDPILIENIFGTAKSLLDTINNKSLLDHKSYRADWLEILKNYMESRKEEGNNVGLIVAQLDNISKDQSKRAEMLKKVESYFKDYVNMGRNVNTDDATFLLANFYFQMQEMDVSLLPVNVYNKLVSLPQNVGNPLLQKLNAKLHTGANKLSQGFWSQYKDEFNAALKKFYDEKGLTFNILGIEGYIGTELFNPGNTANSYDELFVKEKKKIQTQEGIKEIEFNTFRFHSENSDEFKALSPAAQNLIKISKKIIKKQAEKNNIKWDVEGAVPLVRASLANRIQSMKNSGVPGRYRDLINDLLLDFDSSFGMGEDRKASDVNIFHSQANTLLEDKREALLGVQADGFVNVDDYSQWSTDLESIMDIFVVEGLRHEVFNELGTSLKAANSIYQWYNSNLLEGRLDGNIDWVNIVKTVNLDNRDVDANTTLNKISRIASRASSVGLYAFNPFTAATAYLGNELTLLSESIANSLSNSNRFSASSRLRAIREVSKVFSTRFFDSEAYDKISLLMRKFRMFNEDIGSLLNGYHKSGDKFILRSKYMFTLLSGADYQSRMHIMIAQMIEDGSWDAYSVVDGRLIYDESKDQRFNSASKLTPQQRTALRNIIAANNADEVGAKLSDGYDDNMINSIRNHANYLLGTNDRESRSLMNFMWTGKAFLASKNWLTAKVDRYTLGLGLDKSPESGTIGQYVFEQDANGNTYAFWKGDQLEGIIMSWLAMFDNLRRTKEQKVPLTEVQKNNISRSLTDVAIVTLSLALMAIEWPWEEDKKNLRGEAASKIYRNALDDLLTLTNLVANPSFVWTPIGFAYFETTGKRVFRSVYDMDPEPLLKSIPIARELERLYEITYNEDFEIVNK